MAKSGTKPRRQHRNGIPDVNRFGLIKSKDQNGDLIQLFRGKNSYSYSEDACTQICLRCSLDACLDDADFDPKIHNAKDCWLVIMRDYKLTIEQVKQIAEIAVVKKYSLKSIHQMARQWAERNGNEESNVARQNRRQTNGK